MRVNLNQLCEDAARLMSEFFIPTFLATGKSVLYLTRTRTNGTPLDVDTNPNIEDLCKSMEISEKRIRLALNFLVLANYVKTDKWGNQDVRASLVSQSGVLVRNLNIYKLFEATVKNTALIKDIDIIITE